MATDLHCYLLRQSELFQNIDGRLSLGKTDAYTFIYDLLNCFVTASYSFMDKYKNDSFAVLFYFFVTEITIYVISL